MIKLLFSESIPKESILASSNEDAFRFSSLNQTFSLCDGASESFDSKSWANILAQHFIMQPEVSEEWMMECIQKYIKGLDFSNLTASQCIAFEKGSFATLIGVKNENNFVFFQAGEKWEIPDESTVYKKVKKYRIRRNYI